MSRSPLNYSIAYVYEVNHYFVCLAIGVYFQMDLGLGDYASSFYRHRIEGDCGSSSIVVFFIQIMLISFELQQMIITIIKSLN